MATTIFDMNFLKHDNDSTLRVLVYANLYSPDDITFAGEIILDGTTVQMCRANIIMDQRNSRGEMPLSPFAFVTGVAAGLHRIQFVVTNLEDENLDLVIRRGATMEVAELKQAAR